MSRPKIALFGEVLFDIFPSGEKILGGAPFNVAWSLQAFGNEPLFISRVGQDSFGREILQAMHAWEMNTEGVQYDPDYATGQVHVELINDEPEYQIVPDCAYDFICVDQLPELQHGDLLYHGTLGLRNTTSRNALELLKRSADLSIFLDVNLRAPWWTLENVETWLLSARWVKLNQEELRALGFRTGNQVDALECFQERFPVEQVILTCGAAGAMVRTQSGVVHHLKANPSEDLVDTIGAGDAFSAIYLHGLLRGWSIPETLDAAQKFAGKVLGLRGATTNDALFYRDFVDTYIEGQAPTIK